MYETIKARKEKLPRTVKETEKHREEGGKGNEMR